MPSSYPSPGLGGPRHALCLAAVEDRITTSMIAISWYAKYSPTQAVLPMPKGLRALRARLVEFSAELDCESHLWFELERLGIICLVVMHTVYRYADVNTCGKILAIHNQATFKDFSRQQSAYGGGKAHGLVDTCKQKGA